MGRHLQVLIDPELRAVYDVSGEKGLRGRESKNRGAAWAVWESWDEFKPFQRKLVAFQTLHYCGFHGVFPHEKLPVYNISICTCLEIFLLQALIRGLSRAYLFSSILTCVQHLWRRHLHAMDLKCCRYFSRLMKPFSPSITDVQFCLVQLLQNQER